MKKLDLYLQRARINKVRPFLRKGDFILDVGCGDGSLFKALADLRGLGLDSGLPAAIELPNAKLLPGRFPDALPDDSAFDAIVLLAVLEHIPESEHAELAAQFARHIKPSGLLLITTPHPLVDRILKTLIFLRVIDGMNVEQHHHFDVRKTGGIFCRAGFELLVYKRFQLGLNHLFVFVKK